MDYSQVTLIGDRHRMFSRSVWDVWSIRQRQMIPNVFSCLKITWQMANCEVDIPLKSFNS